MTPETTFAPLPVRRRELLEVFDTGLKLYRRYFWVLLAWSAISNALSVMFCCVSILFVPFEIGACACCIAAAVRGQTVTFGQCWRFLKPRYGSVVGQLLLVMILAVMATMGVSVVSSIATAILGGLLGNLPYGVLIPLTVVWYLVNILASMVVNAAITAWVCMTPIIVCLEDDKRGGAAQTRAWDLLRMNWWRATGLYTLLGAAWLAIFGIFIGGIAVVQGLQNFGRSLEGMVMGENVWGLLGWGTFFATLFTLAMPLMLLVTGVFYLDLRVRKEALDLEWTAHVSGPADAAKLPAGTAVAPQPGTPNAAGPVELAPSNFGSGPALPAQTGPAPAPAQPPAPTPGFSMPPPPAVAPSPTSMTPPPPWQQPTVAPPPAAPAPAPVETSSFGLVPNPPAPSLAPPPAPEPVSFGNSPTAQDESPFVSSFGAGPSSFGASPEPSPSPSPPNDTPPVVEWNPSPGPVDPPRTD